MSSNAIYPLAILTDGGAVPEHTTDATALMQALIRERSEWRRGNGVYTVPVMLAHGQVIDELEKIIDFEEGEELEGDTPWMM